MCANVSLNTSRKQLAVWNEVNNFTYWPSFIHSTYWNLEGPFYNAVSSVLEELVFWSTMFSHRFYPLALTFSGEESWGSPTFWSAPGSQHPRVDRVASSESKLFQMPATFRPGACDQQLVHQPDSLPKPKKYSLILMKHSAREALNTERAMCMDSLALVHWTLEDLTSSEPQSGTCTLFSPRAALWQLPLLWWGWAFRLSAVLLDPSHSKHTEQLHWNQWPKVPHCYHLS